MIPDFKTYINESIWSDMQDRSAGDVVRKEDDINLMSGEDFCDYLNDNYISKDGYRTYRIYDVCSRVIYEPPLMNISSILKQKYLTKISKEKSMSKYVHRHFVLISTKPKKGDIDNRFVIDVIDTYIDIMDTLKNIDKHIKRK